MSDWPKVTALILAYNYGPYLTECVESALGQRYDGELEVIVVDDGSTDDTPAVLAAFGDRIRVIRQENAGVNAAMTRGMRAATGEVIALLDADDAWVPEKLKLQVPELLANPEVGLVYSDFMSIDAAGKPVEPSYFARQNVLPPSGRVLGTFVRQCMSWGSTIVLRASLIDHILPVPPEASFQDAYVSARAAEVCEFAYVAKPLMRYRVHGDNAWAQATGAKALRNARKDIDFLRWLIVNRPLDELTIDELSLARTRLTWLFEHAAKLAGHAVVHEIGLTDERRATWRTAMLAAGAARAHGDPAGGVRHYLTASAINPLDLATRRAWDQTFYEAGEYAAAAELVAEAEAAFERGDVAAALDGLRTVAGAQAATGELAGRVHNDLAVILAGLGSLQEAEAEALLALDAAPDYAPALETLAWLRRQEIAA